MAILLGFTLLFLLLLGAAVFLLALIFLAIGAGIQLFAALIGSSAAWVPTLAMGVQLAAGAAFALGLVLAAIGLAAFLFPSVRAFVKGLLLLFRLAANNLQGLLALLPPLLETMAGLLEYTAMILVGPLDPPLSQAGVKPVKDLLTEAGGTLESVGNNFPQIPSPQPTDRPLFREEHDDHSYKDGFVPNPFGLPQVRFVTGVTLGFQAVPLVPQKLVQSGQHVNSFAAQVAGIAQMMRNAAADLRNLANLVQQALQ